EGKLADAAIGIQERRFFHADALLDSVEHDIFATRELMRSSAAEVLGQARGEVARAKADGIQVDTAAQMLQDAETSYSEARYGDTIYAGKACISEVEELAHAAADTKRKSDADVARSKQERTEEIHRRMESVRAEIQDLLPQNVDLAHALETLGAAEQAIDRGSLEEAEHLVASADGIVKGVKVTLNHQAKGALERARKEVEQATRDAIEDRNFDDVDVILTDLDATAKELMNELVAASRNLIGRAERKIHEGRDAGLEVEKAVAHLDTAEAAFQRGEYADAVEHARAA